MGHKNWKLGVAEHVVGDAAGQRFPERALRVSPHNEKIGVEARCFAQEGIAQPTIV